MSSNQALILIDYINEIVHPDGKLSGKGYSAFIDRHNIKSHIEQLINKFRENESPIIHVRVGFSNNYIDHPESSPLFGAAKTFNALNLSEWGCEFIDYARPLENEVIIHKSRVSAFFNTNLDTILRCNSIDRIFIAGCSTDLAVQSAIRDAHDRDYKAAVILDACVAANDVDHNTSIAVLEKLAETKNIEDL